MLQQLWTKRARLEYNLFVIWILHFVVAAFLVPFFGGIFWIKLLNKDFKIITDTWENLNIQKSISANVFMKTLIILTIIPPIFV